MKGMNKKTRVMISLVVTALLILSVFTVGIGSVTSEENEDAAITIDQEVPEDGEEGVRIEGMNTTLSVFVNHTEDKEMNVTFYGGESDAGLDWINNVTVEGEGYANVTWEDLEYETWYTWYVNVTDNENYTESEQWEFETEYLPNKPVVISPDDEAENWTAQQPDLTVEVTHPEEHDLNVWWYAAESGVLTGDPEVDDAIASMFGVESGNEVTRTWEENLSYDQEYEWYVEVEGDQDGHTTISDMWTFETLGFDPVSWPGPEDEEEGVEIYPGYNTTLNVTVEHPESKEMNVTFYDGDGVEIGYNYTETNGSVDVTWEDLEYGTWYEWSVMVEDEIGEIREAGPWTFETEYRPNKPTLNNPEHEETFLFEGREMELNVTVNHPEDESMTVRFYDGEDNLIGSNTGVSDGEYTTVTWDELETGTTYHWYVEVEEEIAAGEVTTSDTWEFTTEEFEAPEHPLNPEHEGENVSAQSRTLEVNVSHPAGDELNVTFYDGDHIELGYDVVNGDAGENVSASIPWDENLSYDMEYVWYVIVEDESEDTRQSDMWTFETYEFDPISWPGPGDEETGVRIGPEMETDLNVTVEHPEEKSVNVTFYDGEGVEIGNVTVDTDQEDEASVTWDELAYETWYEWSVMVEDEIGETREAGPWTFETEFIPNVPELNFPDDEEPGVEIGPEMETDLNVTVRHPEDDDFIVRFKDASDDGVIATRTITDPDGEEYAEITWDELEYETWYEWYVEVEDGEGRKTTSDIWSFETEYIPNVPELNFPVPGQEDVELVNMATELNVSVRHPEGKMMNVTFYGNETGQTLEEIDHVEAVGDGYVNTTWEELEYGTEYTWYVNVSEYEAEDTIYTTSEEWTFTTEGIEIDLIEPKHEEIDVEVYPGWNTTLSVYVTHPDEQEMNVTFYGNETGYGLDWINNVTVEGEGYANVTWEDLSNATMYKWYIVLEDEDNRTIESDEWTFTTIGEYYNLTVEEPVGGDIYVDGEIPDEWPYEDELLEGTEVELEAVAAENYEFEYWEINEDTYDDAVITITMNEDKEVSAHFEEVEVPPEEYDLTISIDGEGSTDPAEGTHTYEEGEVVTVEATPAEGWEFVEWTGDETGTETTIEITMDSDKSITAVFEEEPEPPEPEAYFEVEITDYDDEVEEGDTVTVEFTVENTGDAEGTQDIVFSVDGAEEDSVEITLDVGDTYSGEFTWEAGEPGDYDLEVASEDDSDSVTVTVEEEPGFLEQLIPGFTTVLLMISVIIAVAIYYKKEQ